MDFPQVPQQCEVHFPGNASPAADAHWSTIAFPAHQHPRSAPFSYRQTVSGQPRGYAGEVQDTVFLPANAAGNRRLDEVREDVPPPVENTAAHGRPQDLRYVDYDMANGHHPLREHRDHAINNHAGVALNVPTREQAAPPAPINIFDGPDWNTAADPARALPNEWPPHDPLPNRQVNEVLRQLAILYLREPNSQVAALRMEPSHARGIRVVITLELADI